MIEDQVVDSRKAISDYIFYSKYSRTKSDGKKETWNEAVIRVMQFHHDNLSKRATRCYNEFKEYFHFAWDMYTEQKVLGAQRVLQYAGSQLSQHNTRLYNCCASYADRIAFFEEIMYLLLSGCGAGFSVQKIHTDKLPIIKGVNKRDEVTFVIPDSIEGWAEAVGKLIKSYYLGGKVIKFDYSQIREKGAYISGGFSAPGYEPLEKCIEKIKSILGAIKNRKLRPFEIHYITCVIADAVVSGGVRRSAMISMFDIDDDEMLKCKTGEWFIQYPELCRCNNSATILPDCPREKYDTVMSYVREYGEPGIIFTKDPNYIYNPCAEVGLFPQYGIDGNNYSGWGFCNLTEINGAKIKTEEDFYKACEAAAILGTFQAVYTDFKVLDPTSKKIAERDALIGVGITGMADCPDILFNEEVQRKGAEIVKEVNKKVAFILGIKAAARTTVIKPSGNSSQLLGCGSGIHAYHFRKYIRNIQAADTEQSWKEVQKNNPHLISPSYWNPDGEKVLSFPIELPENVLVRTDYTTIEFLERIYSTKMNWIEYGTNFDSLATYEQQGLRMNVSCTVSVKENEWENVFDWIWQHKEGFAGISFLPESGDLDYPQAPYTSYLNAEELLSKYGNGAMLSSGLIVDGLNIFKDIYTACNAALGNANSLLNLSDEDISYYIMNHLKDGRFLVKIDGVGVSDVNAVIDHLQKKVDDRIDWVRRFDQFANNYFNGDKELCARCLKHVNIFHLWHKVKKYKEVDWKSVVWENAVKEAGSDVATGCMGGACEL